MGKKESRSLITLCSFVCWHVWLSRNDLVFGRKVWQPTEVISAAIKAFQEFNAIPSNVISYPPSMVALPQQWIAPTTDYVKCNCDASYSANLNKSGVGFICRDHNGLPLIAISCPSSFSDILVGEAIVVQLSIMGMITNGFERVMIGFDNMNLITYIKDGGGTSPLHIRALVDNIIHLSSSFVSCCFFFIPQEINSVADSLTRRPLPLTCATD
ncbi:uncharacterized protein LOC122643182 [Telopea speciosissima]|uniref:uncharacterized protein LOC122643182 n=1 Tax=Telopea speciosissima TaxID=54955 RepID=UPI001CC7CA74|nr:uncharacterized protein LOC122643182 [Telopea speciosissima]